MDKHFEPRGGHAVAFWRGVWVAGYTCIWAGQVISFFSLLRVGAENPERVYKSMGGLIKPHSGRVRASQGDMIRVMGRKYRGA